MALIYVLVLLCVFLPFLLTAMSVLHFCMLVNVLHLCKPLCYVLGGDVKGAETHENTVDKTKLSV